MEPDTVVETLKELDVADVLLFEALSRRFHSNAEEFFPPQIDGVVSSFARLQYSDEALLRGFAGRLGDLASDASARRVVRLLRHGAALQLRPSAWLDGLIPQLREQLPNIRHGAPSALAALHQLRRAAAEAEVAEMLLVQGSIVADEEGDDGYRTRLFESWSRTGLPSKEVEAQAAALATSGTAAVSLDLRDALNLLAGLSRYKKAEMAKAREQLEGELEARLKGTGGGGSDGGGKGRKDRGTPGEEAALCLEWMLRLSLRSTKLWQACADSVEVAMKDPVFARQRLPDAAHALASLAGGAKEAEEFALVDALLASQETQSAARFHTAWQSAQLLRAGCMARLGHPKGSAPLDALFKQAARTARQLSLPELRSLREAVEVLPSLGVKGAGLEAPFAAVRALELSALPPLGDDDDAGRLVADVGGQGIFVTSEAKRSGYRYLGLSDTFAQPPEAVQTQTAVTPSCRLSMAALKAQGWEVEMRA